MSKLKALKMGRQDDGGKEVDTQLSNDENDEEGG